MPSTRIHSCGRATARFRNLQALLQCSLQVLPRRQEQQQQQQARRRRRPQQAELQQLQRRRVWPHLKQCLVHQVHQVHHWQVQRMPQAYHR